MNIKDVLAISEMPGLYKLVNSRSNGLFVQSIEGGKTKFCSSRKHNFTPLETVAIYTLTDTVELKDVFERIHGTDTVPTPKDDKNTILAYFDEVIPDYDEDRVHVSDMKKILKWYKQLNTTGLMDAAEEIASDEEE